jgi:hypothetical protein
MKRALLIGINYTGTDSALNGCVNDISNINKFLLENVSGYSKDSITVLTDDPKSSLKPTKQNMESNIKKFVTGCKSGDTLFFYYSGHGSQLSDNNGDESDGRDSVLVPADYKTSGVIRDDWLFANMVNCLPAGVLLWTFTDCCHSGTMLDLQFNLQSNSVYTKGNSNKNIKYNSSEWSNQFGLSNEKSTTSQADVFNFSGCLDPQTSADAFIRNQSQGAFTACFFEFVNSNSTPDANNKLKFNTNKIKLSDMLKEINCRLVIQGFKQRPQLSMGKVKDFNRLFCP